MHYQTFTYGSGEFRADRSRQQFNPSGGVHCVLCMKSRDLANEDL